MDRCYNSQCWGNRRESIICGMTSCLQRVHKPDQSAGRSESSGLFAPAKRDERETTSGVSGPHSLPRYWDHDPCGACTLCKTIHAKRYHLFRNEQEIEES